MRKRLAILGGVGNGLVIAKAAEADGWEILGFISDDAMKLIDGYPVLAPICEAHYWHMKHNEVFLAFGLQKVAESYWRFEMLDDLQLPVNAFAAIKHPSAVLAGGVRQGHGVIFMPGAVVSPGAYLGDLTQMYGNSFVGHNTFVGDRVFISNNATVGGSCRIETGAHIGSNATIRENVHIGQWAVVGAGAVVLKAVSAFEVVVGNPARHLRYIEP